MTKNSPKALACAVLVTLLAGCSVETKHKEAQQGSTKLNDSGGLPTSEVATVEAQAPTLAQQEEAAFATASQDVANDFSHLPEATRQIIRDELAADELCRGGSSEALIGKWCPKRDALSSQLEAMGFCWGKPADGSSSYITWYSCRKNEWREARDQVQEAENVAKRYVDINYSTETPQIKAILRNYYIAQPLCTRSDNRLVKAEYCRNLSSVLPLIAEIPMCLSSETKDWRRCP